MARSNGYRPKKAVRDEVFALRQKLGTLTGDRWAAASVIMEQITTLLGHRGGPSHGRIEPRCCKYCGYFGHTKQHCEKRKVEQQVREECEAAALLRQDQAYFATLGSTDDAWVESLKRIEERVEEGERRGLGKCRVKRKAATTASEIVLDCKCEGCKEWRAWVKDVL